MAGDWIKVEHATIQKTEVALFSELLGIQVDHGVGLLVRFWLWLDHNSCHGDVTHVSRRSLDDNMHCPGFSGALEAVGWIKFDDSKYTATIPNFDRHNGNSAKSRALARDRKAVRRQNGVTQMSRNSHAAGVTRDRGRDREETTSAAAPIALTAGAWVGIADSDLAAWTSAYPAVDVKTELAKAAAWAQANPKNRKSNWQRFLVNWLCKAQDRAPRVVVPISTRSAKVAL